MHGDFALLPGAGTIPLGMSANPTPAATQLRIVSSEPNSIGFAVTMPNRQRRWALFRTRRSTPKVKSSRNYLSAADRAGDQIELY